MVSYFREVKSELRKVHWPSRQETVYYTLTVIAVSVAAAVFLGGLDVLFAYLLNTFLL
ncbi:MAG: preprotein translocase subunit SecE [bacterium]|nr:preprotein translocase subunit SecE [bacterium]